jgi:hypothetical protein
MIKKMSPRSAGKVHKGDPARQPHPDGKFAPVTAPDPGKALFDAGDLTPCKTNIDGLSRADFGVAAGFKVNGIGAAGIEKLLRTIAQCGIPGIGAMAVGWTHAQLLAARRNYPALDAAVGAAIEIHTDFVEQIVRDRVVNGVPQPVTFKGELIGWSRYYSDRLAELFLRAKRPQEFCEKIKHEHIKALKVDDSQQISGDLANLSAGEKIDLVKLLGKLQGLEPKGAENGPAPKKTITMSRDVASRA